MAPRPAPPPPDRSPVHDPTDGDGINNPEPTNPVDPTITTDDGGGIIPPGGAIGVGGGAALLAPLTVLLDALVALAGAAIGGGITYLFDQLADATSNELLGDELTEAERRGRDACLDRRMPPNVAMYGPVEPTPPDAEDRSGRATRGEICILGGSWLQGEGNTKGEKYTPTGWVQSVHDKGHLVANTLGGSDLKQENIVPLFPCTNRRLMQPIEMQLKYRIGRDGETFYYRVTAIYEDGGPVPTHIRIVALGDKGTEIRDVLPNKKDCLK